MALLIAVSGLIFSMFVYFYPSSPAVKFVDTSSTEPVDVASPISEMDEHVLLPNDRVLLRHQLDVSENGVYIWKKGKLVTTRAKFPISFLVKQGTRFAGRQFVLTDDKGGVLDTNFTTPVLHLHTEAFDDNVYTLPLETMVNGLTVEITPSGSTSRIFQLPALSSAINGFRVTLVRTANGPLTVHAAAGDTLGDGSPVTLDKIAQTVSLQALHASSMWVIV